MASGPSTTWVVIDDHGGGVSVDGVPGPDRVVCADAGVSLALALGLTVDVVVGDLDSVCDEDLAEVEAAGADVQRHPTDKDRTDLELALAEAAAGGGEVVLVGGAGGRLDHALANVSVLANDDLGAASVRARLGGADVHVVRDRVQLALDVGATVTLLASGGAAHGVTTTGLRYPLRAETLGAWSARGISNVVEEPPVRVEVDAGCLFVIVPGTDA